MQAFFASGHAVDAVLAVLFVETLVLLALRRERAVRIFAAALPGAFLLLALRASLTGAGWSAIALWLALSFPAHLADLRIRTR